MIRKLFVALSLAWLAAAAWALPTVEQVQSEVQRGNYAQAESMMSDVVAAKPGSAKAHYLYAEILAHNGSFAKAADEARRAKQIDPQTKFTQPEKFRAFEASLARELNPAPRVQPPVVRQPEALAVADESPLARSFALPSWVWVVGLAVVGMMLWRAFSRSRAAAAVAPPQPPMAGLGGGNGYAAPMMAPGAPPYGSGGMPYGQPAASAIGGGLLGTGLAVAGGVAAGLLVDEMLHRRQAPATADHLSGLGPQPFDAPFPDNGARELESRPIDFGNGADWDAGNAADGAANDTSDDGGWS